MDDYPSLWSPSLTRAAMSSIQQLRLDLTSTGDQPSANLAIYFKVGLHLHQTATFPLHEAHPNPLSGGVADEVVWCWRQ